MSQKESGKNYVSLDRVRVFYDAELNVIKLTGKYGKENKPLHSVITPGSTLESQFRNLLVNEGVIETPFADESDLPEIAVMDYSHEPSLIDETKKASILENAGEQYSPIAKTHPRKVSLEFGKRTLSADPKEEGYVVPVGVLAGGNVKSVEILKKKDANILVAGGPGSGKSVLLEQMYRNIQTNYPDVTCIAFDPVRTGSPEANHTRPFTYSDPIEFLVYLRMLENAYYARNEKTQGKVVIFIDTYSYLNLSRELTTGTSADSSRVDKAVNAEILSRVLRYSQQRINNLDITFVISTQRPEPHDGPLIETCGTTIHFRSPNNHVARLIFGDAQPEISNRGSGLGYIATDDGGLIKPEIFRAFMPMN